MSIYLELVETVPDGLEITVTANFFIFNHLENKYFGCNGTIFSTMHHSLCTHYVQTSITCVSFIYPVCCSWTGNALSCNEHHLRH